MIKKPTIIKKPWGHEEIWAQGSLYAGKILVIKKGHRLSRQYHKLKEETIMVLDGVLLCEEGPHRADEDPIRHVMPAGEIFHVSPGTIHRFCAEEGDVRLVEVSSHQTDDVVRLEDDYRRIEDFPEPLPESWK